jgi:large subunit ribosomal protein L9
MEVILKADVPKLGKSLEIVNVKNGYARNFLFPRKLAILATKDNRLVLEKNRAQMEAQLKAERDSALSLIAKLAEAAVTLSVKVSEGEKLYGSVNAHEIAENLKNQGFKIEKRHIVLEQPIKQLGVYSVGVHLMSGVDGKVKVWVIKDEA